MRINAGILNLPMIKNTRTACSALVLLLICFLIPLHAFGEIKPVPEEHVFVLKEYRYVPGQEGGDKLTGLMLCKTRCYALSVDYLTYTIPGGWYLQKIADARDVTVELNNPFMDGQCVCVADEFVLKVNDLYMVKKPRPESLKE